MKRASLRGIRTASTAAALVALGWTATADAHQTSVVYLNGAVEGRTLGLTVRIADRDLGEPSGSSPLWTPDRARVRDRAAQIERYVLARITVRNGNAACPGTAEPFAIAPRADGGFDLRLPLRFECARQIDALAIHYALFFDLDPGHRGLLDLRAFDRAQAAAFSDTSRDFVLQGRASLFAQLRDYFVLGIEHIFTGYDHLAFLLTLLIAAAAMGRTRGTRHAIALVTAFTLAHSITLVSAALGIVTLPSRLVESAIALSIAWVALENVFRKAPRGRSAVTFAFGLIHGFGFAGVLAELGLPARGAVASLLAFNLGVEAGQIALVLLTLPALQGLSDGRFGAKPSARRALLALGTALLLSTAGPSWRVLALIALVATLALDAGVRRFGYDRVVRIALGCVIAFLGLWWFAERVLGRSFAGGVLG